MYLEDDRSDRVLLVNRILDHFSKEIHHSSKWKYTNRDSKNKSSIF